MANLEFNPIEKTLDLVGNGGGQTIQVTTLPTASASQLGKIYQYVGATTADYTHGYFYECVILNPTDITEHIDWIRCNVQPNDKIGKVYCRYAVDESSQLSTKDHGAGYTCLCKGDGKIYTSDGTAWNGGVLGILGVLYIAESETYVYDTNKFVLISTDNAKTLNGHNENYFAKESEAAKKSGSYPNMSVGSASNLNGVDTVNTTYLRRTSGGSADIGSGMAQIRSLKGNSYVWNQKNPIPLFDDLSYVGESIGVTVTDTTGEITIATNTQSYNYNRIGIRTKVDVTHKFYFTLVCKGNNNSNILYKEFVLTETYSRIHSIQTSLPASFSNFIRIYPNSFADYFNPNSYITIDKTKPFYVIDLTIMFGAGNEPATAEAFESWCAAQGIDLDKLYPYNEGEVINCKTDAIKTDGFNQYDHSVGKANVIKGNVYQITGAYTSLTIGGETLTPDASGYFTPTISGELTVTGGNDVDTCVHLKWSGKKDGEFETYWAKNHNLNLTTITGKVNGQGASEVMFPDGLVKVGNMADEIIVDSDGKARRAIKRFGKQSVTGAIGDTITLTGCKADTTNAVCAKGALSAIGPLSGTTLTLTAAVTSLNVYFELATSVEYTLDTPLNMTYRVDDFGTETAMVLSSGSLVEADITKTAPLNYDVRYSLNVVDTVRNLKRNYLGMTGTQNTFAAISSALAEYGMTMTLGTYDTTNEYYPVTISGGWKPASTAPVSTERATGDKGMYYIDRDYFYICVETNVWKRFSLSEF